jgi:hypothetical protein
MDLWWKLMNCVVLCERSYIVLKQFVNSFVSSRATGEVVFLLTSLDIVGHICGCMLDMEMLCLRIWASSVVVIDFGLDMKWCAGYKSMPTLISYSIREKIRFIFYIVKSLTCFCYIYTKLLCSKLWSTMHASFQISDD